MEDIILRERAVSKIVGFSPSTIRRKEKAGQFPKRIRLGPNMVGWKSGLVYTWIRSREETDGSIEKSSDEDPS